MPRFATLAEMNHYAFAFQRNTTALVTADAMIYTDNNGLTHRPAVMLYNADNAFVPVMLMWNAMTNAESAGIEELDHMGRNARTEARDMAEWLQNYIQETINHANRV